MSNSILWKTTRPPPNDGHLGLRQRTQYPRQLHPRDCSRLIVSAAHQPFRSFSAEERPHQAPTLRHTIVELLVDEGTRQQKILRSRRHKKPEAARQRKPRSIGESKPNYHRRTCIHLHQLSRSLVYRFQQCTSHIDRRRHHHCIEPFHASRRAHQPAFVFARDILYLARQSNPIFRDRRNHAIDQHAHATTQRSKHRVSLCSAQLQCGDQTSMLAFHRNKWSHYCPYAQLLYIAAEHTA